MPMFETPTIGKTKFGSQFPYFLDYIMRLFLTNRPSICYWQLILGDADVVLADAGTGQILNTVHVNQKIRKLLAVGKR